MYGPFDRSQAAAGQPLDISIRNVAPNTILCRLAGEIDLASGPPLQKKLMEVIHDGLCHVVIDMADVSYLASAGLDVLTRIHSTQHRAGYHFAIVVHDNDAAARPLQITRLDQVLDLHAELRTAVEACQAHRKTDGSQAP
jgi:anti-anti-sigma factor